jgi:hypothetical protein
VRSPLDPSTSTCPESGRTNPATARRTDDLPQPEGPRRHTVSPGRNGELTLSTAWIRGFDANEIDSSRISSLAGGV